MRSPPFCYDGGMSNRILHVRVHDHSLDPAQAELWISATAEHVAPTTELRGRLMGPRCAYAATVEVAYPFRLLLRRPEGLADLAVRAVIPEPSLWEPACPFVYQGTVELWEDGTRRDQVVVNRGLRRVLLGPAGLRVNGEPLVLRGRAVMECDEDAAVSLRRGGVNLLLTAAAGSPAALWDIADRQGFFVLARLNDWRDASLKSAVALSDHPSCLGWLLPPGARDAAAVVRRLNRQALVGVELGEAPRDPMPAGVNFIACSAGLADGLRPLGLPVLLLNDGPASPGVFGTVE